MRLCYLQHPEDRFSRVEAHIVETPWSICADWQAVWCLLCSHTSKTEFLRTSLNIYIWTTWHICNTSEVGKYMYINKSTSDRKSRHLPWLAAIFVYMSLCVKLISAQVPLWEKFSMTQFSVSSLQSGKMRLNQLSTAKFQTCNFLPFLIFPS